MDLKTIEITVEGGSIKLRRDGVTATIAREDLPHDKPQDVIVDTIRTRFEEAA